MTEIRLVPLETSDREQFIRDNQEAYPIVIIPILMTHYVMLQRNLIYTGVTRAKKVLIIVGSKKALAMAVRNMNVQKRNTMLTDRIKQQFVGVIAQ